MRAWLPGGVVVWNTKGNFTSGDIKNWLLGMYGIDNNGLSGAFERVHWETYGWNGSAWELDNPNGRPFHSSYEELADGVTVAFNVAGGSPEGTFVAGEYYTVAVVDGIMADGATTFDHRHVYYMKPAVFNVTDFETATLPAAPQTMLAGLSTGTRVNDSGAYSAGLTWTDTAGNKSFSSTQITNGSLIGGGRTNNEIPAGEDGDVYFTMYSGSGFDNSTAGLSDVAKRGTAINRDTIDYGFRWNVGLGSQSWEVQIVENGVVVATIDDGDSVYFSDDPSGTGSAMDRSNEQYISHRIKRVGTTIEYYWREKLVHTSTVPSSTALCFDAWLAQYIGIAYVSINYPFTDYIGEFGNSTLQTGKFDPDFFQIVSMGESQPTVLIGGVQGTHIGFNDYTTALAAGEYSILTNGYLRYSAADAGKTIAVDYTYLKHV